MFKLVSFVVTLFFLMVGITLGVLNPTAVTLDLFILQPQVPLSMVMAVTLILGMVFGALMILVQVMRLRWKLRKQIRANRKLSDQIVQLKKANVQAKEASRVESKEAANTLVNLKK
jgi:putative membrane protein